jgi:hypothetical protein
MKKNKNYKLLCFIIIGLLLNINKLAAVQFSVIDIHNKIYNLFDKLNNKKYIVILYSDYNCLECMKKIEAEMKEVISNDSILDYCVLIRCNNDIIDKRNNLNKVKKLFTTKKIFFDIHYNYDNWPPLNLDEGIFGIYNVTYTPSLVILYQNRVYYISYNEIILNNKKFTIKPFIYNRIKN